MVLFVLILLLTGILLLRIFRPGTQTDETAQSKKPEAAMSAAAASSVPEPTSKLPPEESADSDPASDPAAQAEKTPYTARSYQLVSDIVYTYATGQREAMDEIDALLGTLRREDRALGELWTEILRTWDFVNTDLETPATLPDDLPEDDSLCIVVLGFQLMPDGSMSEELLGRCRTALACAERYPEAWIAVTGGPTAWQDHSATEAGVMAAWFADHGIGEERILVEGSSLTTADNAVLTAAILRERAPQVKTLALVSSDYHLPLGWLLFEEEALVLEYETGEKPFRVAACAAYDASDWRQPDTPMQQKSYVWSVADPKY